MSNKTPEDNTAPAPAARQHGREYESPTLACYGYLAAVTQKSVGSADGTTFLGLDIGSVPPA